MSAPGTPNGTERRGSEMMAYFALPTVKELVESPNKNNRVIAIDFVSLDCCCCEQLGHSVNAFRPSG